MSYAALAAAAGGLVLIISLFIGWVGTGSFSANAWDIFSLMDIVLFAIGVAAILLALMEFPAVNLRTPFARHRALTILGVISTTWIWGYIFESDSHEFGVFLAGLSALAILAGGILAERSPREGFTFGGRAAEIAGGGGLGGPGAGGGAAVQPGGFAQPAGQAPATTPLGGGGTAPAPGTGIPDTGAGAAAVEPATQAQPATEAQPAAAQTTPAIQSLPLGDQNPPPPDRPGQPADWYSDPTGQKRLRYWDGSRWTEHVAD